MADNIIELVVRTKKTGTGGKEAKKELTDLEKAAQSAGKMLKGYLTIQGAKAAWQLAELGAQSLRTKQAFAMISGGALNAADNLDAMKRATRGAMSEQAMMASANQLLQMGLASNAAELEQVTMMATRLGSAMGKSAGPAVEEFALMLANQSIPRLDTFGISASKVRARILELQAATPGLSREVAFMTATMEEGEVAMERLGEAVDDELLANERLIASMEDLKVVVGEELAPAMAELANATTDAISGFKQAQDEIERLKDRTSEAAVNTARWNDLLYEITGGIYGAKDSYAALEESVWGNILANETLMGSENAMIDQMHDAIIANEALMGSENAMIGRTREVAVVSEEAAGSMYELNASAKTVAGSFGEMEFDDEQLWKMALASGAEIEQLEALALHLGIATEAEIANTLEGYRLTEMFSAGALTAEQYAARISALETATIDAAGGFEGLGADALIAEKGLGAMQVAQEQAVTAVRDMSAKYGESEADFAAAEDARLGAIESAREMKKAEEEATEMTEAFRDAEERAASEAVNLKDDIRELTVFGVQPLSEAAEDAELKTLGLREEMGVATDQAFEFGENISLVNDVLHMMEGEYTVVVHYESTGSAPGAHDVPGHQSGTAFHRGGLAIIGERGPELVALPRGSRVWPADSPQTRAAVNNRYNYGGDTIIINDRLAAALYMERRRHERIQRIERM